MGKIITRYLTNVATAQEIHGTRALEKTELQTTGTILDFHVIFTVHLFSGGKGEKLPEVGQLHFSHEEAQGRNSKGRFN